MTGEKEKDSVSEKRGAWWCGVGLGPCYVYICIHAHVRWEEDGVEWKEVGERGPGEES